MKSVIVTIIVLISLPLWSFGKTGEIKKDSTATFDATISLTNNGVSFIPAFTLDAPAAMAVFSLSKKRWLFSLNASFAITGRPWINYYTTQYTIISDKKQDFSLSLQFPYSTFIKRNIIENGIEKEIVESQQGYSPVLSYARFLTEKWTWGGMYSPYFGIGDVWPKRGDYVATWISRTISIGKKTKISINEQIFYLTMDENHGWYNSGYLTISKDKFPFSISSMYFKTINSNIGGKDGNWNVSLNYKF